MLLFKGKNNRLSFCPALEEKKSVNKLSFLSTDELDFQI